MATASLQPAPVSAFRAAGSGGFSDSGLVPCFLLACAAVLIHGYHPYAEDGGIYLTAVKYVLDRRLYPSATGFATAHLGISAYAPCIAELVRWTGLSVMTALLAIYVVSIWMTLLAAWQSAGLLFTPARRIWGAALLASGLTVPVAGTSLMLLDPYMSARSLSTPCLLFALYWALAAQQRHSERRDIRRELSLCCACCAIATMFHPLMAGYGIVLLTMFGLHSIVQPTVRGAMLFLFGVGAVLTAWAWQRLGAHEPAGYAVIAQTRTYWFLSEWAWYEWAGLVFPLGILAWFGFRRRGCTSARALARAALESGLLAIIIALLFAHRTGMSYAVARLQPLRMFQMIYMVMILFLGAYITASRWRNTLAGAACCASALSLLTAERLTYAHSNHLELPWVRPTNNWTQGFLWIRANTGVHDRIAIDAHYISAAGEDAQNLRAIAERSALPDFSKDGGIASIAPQLTGAWLQAQSAQSGLNAATDAERISRMAPHGIHWIVLERTAKTAFKCPFSNAAVRICQVPQPDALY